MTFEILKKFYWQIPFLPSFAKERFFYFVKGIVRGNVNCNINNDTNHIFDYIKNILEIQTQSSDYVELKQEIFTAEVSDPKIIAYYLPQFYPTEYNDKWWGKGTTEWKNVSKAMPQYIGHYQPRLPGELGFYDLRLKENIERQMELAKSSGIYGFCFYYYWFDGERLLDKPIDLFVNENIDFPFCFCWANESWTKQWNGVSNEIIKFQNPSVESYCNFIDSILPYMKDKRYIEMNGKKVIVVYKPQSVPSMRKVFEYWRKIANERYGLNLYIMVCATKNVDEEQNFLNKCLFEGADAISEFAPAPYIKKFNNITKSKKFVCDKFYGKVFDYKEFVINKKFLGTTHKNWYKAVMPMWDNTSRRANTGSIWDGSTPSLYKMWLKDIIIETTKRNENGELDDKFIFINAWNEWAEGAYLEPDAKWGYGYLNATREAIEEARENKVDSLTVTKPSKGGQRLLIICKVIAGRNIPERRCVA